ncbi:hypothetical protein MPER_09916 [Moniliophthora perniciosa FA553]|nr:hypothetical protein MPER_09916 [Moniliophthora perniciosa FA553]
MVIVILTPEIMILWAMRQWYSAKAIAKQFKKYGWGMPHAFFTIMGGFALYDGDKFRGYLWNDEEEICSEDGEGWGLPQEQSKRYIQQIKKHIQKAQGHSPQGNTLMYNAGSIDQPEESINLLAQERGIPEPPYLLEYFLQKGYITITEGEIKDKSHADFIAKSIALIQTTWFIIQVVARGMKHLAITELEIVTVGFALLNFCTYYLWWHKPLRVQGAGWRQSEKE